MALFEGKTPAERNKMIAAIVLPALAFLFVLRMLFGGSGPSRPAAANTNANRKTTTANSNRAPGPAAEETADNGDFLLMREIRFEAPAYGDASSGRNIFAFYVPPPKPVGPPAGATPVEVAQPTPPPPPPILLSALAPQSVFAGTAGFTMQLSGDKFDPAARVYIDNQEVPTQYRGAQQLTATVPAVVISGQGQRQVVVRTPDGQLFSNPSVLNVMQPPQQPMKPRRRQRLPPDA